VPPLRVSLAYITVAIVWGSTWGAIKIGVTDVPPFTFAIERAVAVAAVLTVAGFALRQRFPRDRRTLAIAAVAGLINTGLSWAIIFWTEQFIPSGLVAVFGASAPVWTAILAHYTVKGDRLSTLKVLGLILGLAGTVLLIGAPNTGEGITAVIATGLLVLMPIMWAVAAILQSRFLTRAAPITTVAVGTWASVVFLAPLAFLELGQPQRWTTASVAAFVYLVLFGTCLGMVLSFWLFRKLRPTTMTFIQVIVPAEAIVIGTVWLGEPVTVRMLGGAALVAAAVALNALAGGGAPSDTEHEAVPRAAAAK
jgi:drug/metabolite transporter (DMT)-like permease